MDPEETMEVAPSADNGNVSVEAPSEQPPTETPAVVEEPTSTPELYKLPDGREVEASVVVEEYKNLLTDYTKKSQALAQKDTNITPKETNANPYADPEYIPQSYAEIIEFAKEAALKELADRDTQRVEAEKAIETEVATQLEEIKKLDPSLNENALFLHATKYGFRDLKVAHANMKDMSEAIKKTQTTTAQNIAKRNDPVSTTSGSPTGTKPDRANFTNAADYLRSLKQA